MITATPEDATLYIARADVEREMKHEDLALVDLEEAILPESFFGGCLFVAWQYLSDTEKESIGKDGL